MKQWKDKQGNEERHSVCHVPGTLEQVSANDSISCIAVVASGVDKAHIWSKQHSRGG